MARGINKVILVGTLGKDPELKKAGNSSVCTFSIATNETWKDKDGEKQERTEWHQVKFFGRLAEIAAEYLKKGAQVYVEGSLRTDKYVDKQGKEKYSTGIIGKELQMLGGGNRSEGGGEGRQQQRSNTQQNRRESQREQAQEEFPDDDIPF